MLAALTQHCRPDTLSNVFASLLSLFNDVQGKAVSILEYRSHFDGLTLKLSQCKVVIPPLLLVMLFLQGLHRGYTTNIVEQFRSCFKSIEMATVDSIMSDVAFHDSFTLVETRKCKSAGGSAPTPGVLEAAAANADNQGNVWQLPFEWLAKYGVKGIKGRWTCAIAGTGICPICHRDEKPFHVPTQCPLLLDLGLKLITYEPAMPSPAPAAPAGASPDPLPAPTPAPGGRAAAAHPGSSTGSATMLLGLLAMVTPVIIVAAGYDTDKDFTWDGDETGAAFGGDPKLSMSVALYPSPSCSHAWVVCTNLLVASTSRSISLPGWLMRLLAKLSLSPTAPSSDGCLTVADSWATDHLVSDKSSFISYKTISGLNVCMGNNSYIPVLGCGTAIFSLNGKCVLIWNVLYIPGLVMPLYSLQLSGDAASSGPNLQGF
jgi:hypothetical protein